MIKPCKRFGFWLIMLTLGCTPALLNAQSTTLTQNPTFSYGIKLQGAAASSEYLPFWLYSNRHGTIDYDSPMSNAVLDFHKHLQDQESGFDYGFGATLVGRYSEHETAFFNQLYGSLAYGAFEFKGGRFYESLGTTMESLSMGSLAISPNATPLPKIMAGFPEYTPLPLTDGYIEFKAAMAHGWFEEDREISRPYLHQKYAYLRLGGDFAFQPYVGLTHQATWAGTGNVTEGDLDDSFGDFIKVFMAEQGDGDPASGEVVYALGDHRGIWDFGFDLRLSDHQVKVYFQKIYNDKDGLKLQTPDGMLGVGLQLPAQRQQLVTGILWEYLYTKDQGGPIPPGNQRDGPGGRDNYYNNYLYRTGWTYEGNTIGNPLFLTAHNPQLGPTANYLLDTGNPFGIANNRIVAHHFGIEGRFSSLLSYKTLITWSRNYGNYYDADLFNEKGVRTDFLSNPEQWSFLTRLSYRPFDPLQLNLSVAADVGELYENRVGVMLGVELLGWSSF